jgi:hypothetical protein
MHPRLGEHDVVVCRWKKGGNVLKVEQLAVRVHLL